MVPVGLIDVQTQRIIAEAPLGNQNGWSTYHGNDCEQEGKSLGLHAQHVSRSTNSEQEKI
jgi:hypothetical protein